MRPIALPASLLLAVAGPLPTAGAGTVTYVDQVRPIFAQRCFNCHNPDKLKGDLDLTTYAGVMAGGSGGAVVAAGDPDASVLVGVLAQTREPKMPPKGDRLADADLATIKAWIAGGCLETASSVAAPSKPKVSLGGAAPSAGGPRPPLTLPMDGRAPSGRPTAAQAMAQLDHAPIIAFSARREVLVVDVERRLALGALPTGEDDVDVLRFSRDGRFLLGAGGVDGARGQAWIWSLPEGRLLTTVGQEMDAVLAADLDVRRGRVALGGPQRIVKVITVADNAIVARIRKHTDWITAIAYSPDGVLLATADRAGGVQVWEAETLAAYQSLAGHTGRVTALDWSADSNILVSASEDGRVRLWSMQAGPDGAVAKEWMADPSGVLAMRVTSDNHILTAGRERTVKAWDAGGTLQRTFPAMNDIAIGVAACEGSDGSIRAVVGADLAGSVQAWAAADGAAVASLPTALPSLEERRTAAETEEATKRTAKDEREAQVAAARGVRDAAQAAATDAQAMADAAAAARLEAIGQRDAAASAQTAAAAAAEVARAALAEADRTFAASNAAVDRWLAALGREVASDRAAQAALAAADAGLRAADDAAAEAERLAAANDTPATKAEAEAKRGAAQAARDQAGQARREAEQASSAVRSAMRSADAAKRSVAEVNEAWLAARSESSRRTGESAAAFAALAAASARLADREAAATAAANVATARAAERSTADAALHAAEAAAEDAGRQLAQAEAIVACCEAGIRRREVDRCRAALDAAREAARPALDAAQAAESAAASADAEVATAEAQVAGAPGRRQALGDAAGAASQATKAADAAVKDALARATARKDERSAAAALLATMSAAASAQPNDAMLAASRDRLAEAVRAMEAAESAAAADATKAGEALAAANAAEHAASEALSAFEHEGEALPARLAALRGTAQERRGAADAAKAAAAVADGPVQAAAAALAAIEAEYRRWNELASAATARP